MAVVVEPSDPVWQIRLLIGDMDGVILSDDELSVLTALHQSPFRAAAQALDIIAVSEALLSKKITSQDLATDGPAVAEALRKQAAQLRAQADADDLRNGDAYGLFEVVEAPYGQPVRPELTEPTW